MILRILAGGRIVFGALLVAAPDGVLRPLARRPVASRERTVARVLGARNVVEGAVLARHAGRGRLLACVAVDATHALSMAALATARPAHRRLALASALVAASTATMGLVAVAAGGVRGVGRTGAAPTRFRPGRARVLDQPRPRAKGPHVR